MANAVALVWDLAAKDSASPAFLRVAGAADKAAAATERASKGIETAGARMAAVGAKMSKAVTLPLLGIAAVSIKMAGDFQQSTNVLVTAAGESVKNLALIRKGILDIATTTGTSWKSVTDGMYQLEKAGYRGAAALQVERAAAQAAREEGASLSTVTAAATSIMASYHLKASDAVMVMNEMKTAAGESKTTMELFAGSLSTVLPLASANKISFADIAGSLASLTQHGTSADEAAQELAFTMRGLSAPNAVAVKEMAQLGISSVDVARKLGDGPGGRGLAGTLNFLSETVLKRMGKSGLVLLSTFNASKVAAADARREFEALGPAAQKVAERYASGALTAAEWGGAVRKLAAPQAALIKQWATTQNNAKGFQQAIRNGVNGSQTYSDALKKMTGGANGLNTVLQLTGESMDGTNKRIATISESTAGAGKDVQGWASTQKLFNVQMDILKQKIAATAIQLGTALLPAVTKLVGWLQSGVKWFTNLSGTQKKILGWSLAILAAIGPVLAIGGKLLSLFKTIGTAALFVGTKTATAFGLMSASAVTNAEVEASTAALVAQAEADKALAVARAAAAIAASTEETDAVLIAGSEQAAQNAAVFAAAQQAKADAAVLAAQEIMAAAEEERAAATVAVSGFGAVGLAIGAVAVTAYGLSKFMSDPHGGNWGMPKSMAKAITDAAQESKSDLADWKASVASIGTAWDQDRYKLGQYTQAQIATSLSKQVAYDPFSGSKTSVLGNAETLGLNLDLVVNAQVDPKAKAKVAAQIKAAIADAQAKMAAVEKVKNQYGQLAVNITGSKEQKQDTALLDQITGLKNLSTALGISASAIDVQLVKADLLAVAYGKLPYVTRDAATQFSLYGKTLDKYDASGAANIEYIKEHVTALDKQKKGMEAGTVALFNQMTALGYNDAAVLKNIETYGKVPKQVFTKALLDSKTAEDKATVLQTEIDAIKQHKVPGVDANTAAGRALLASIQKQIDALKQHHVPTVYVNTATAISGLDAILAKLFQIGKAKPPPVQLPALPILSGGLLPGKATGGLVSGPGSGTSDTAGLFRLSNGEFVSTAASQARNRAALEAGNRGAQLHAGGGATVQNINIVQNITRPEGEPTSISLPASMRRAAAALDSGQ